MISWALAPKITIKSIFLANNNWEQFKTQNPTLHFYVIDEVEKCFIAVTQSTGS